MELELIKRSILEIRGKKVILDFELAKMYQTETKRLKESVRRNIKRFPNDFMFELTPEEWENLRSQIATSSWGGQRYLPFAFNRARCGNVIKCAEFRNCNRSKYKYYAHLRSDASICTYLSRSFRTVKRPRK